mmetsp:Transcript_18559/g.21427  ORF Transcript_18559/g.21427 Transcript_18559/m.21427 type:complete len:123 (+) Transcript_18559:202-570(+)
MAAALQEWNENPVCVMTSDGRLIQGTLIGYDQLQNLILKDAMERVYQLPISSNDGHNNGEDDEEEQEEGVLELVPLGLYIIRGDNVVMISDVKNEIWDEQQKNQFKEFGKAQPLKPVVQFIN